MSNDPLEVSPANRSVSETTSEVDGQAEPSGRKSPTQAEPSFYSESLGKTKSSNQKKEFKGFDRRKKEEKERVHVFGPGSR
ncbi:uncharacterized protein HMPREF1541_04256 [Cyphellophora europaea CBS 101466]|uniref:Uncharacterized protein n=1 Tax=Cyphellophora europaea (strain CBS 101466) TaxID=1220924 RepID=W2RU06_CYPE1|nr:uncharacterized protein HMPREF1541_04256 [Cyphellophora europaea CBS 101466]ETN39981.1 hypothetical protein HMPREF1541_04256 [Cyphellophora europaea CBS 101466]